MEKLTEDELNRFRDIPIDKILNIKPSNRLIKIKCPIHIERTPSFCIYPNGKGYHCFGCGIGGNAIDFMKDLGYNFEDGLLELVKYV